MTRPIDTKGKTSAKCARPGKEEVTSNPLSRVISRWERSQIALRTICRFNSILNVFAINIRILEKGRRGLSYNEIQKEKK